VIGIQRSAFKDWFEVTLCETYSTDYGPMSKVRT